MPSSTMFLNLSNGRVLEEDTYHESDSSPETVDFDTEAHENLLRYRQKVQEAESPVRMILERQDDSQSFGSLPVAALNEIRM